MFKDKVLQISMKFDDKSYTFYITPTRPVNTKSSVIHGLTQRAKNLFKNSMQIETKSKSIVVSEVFTFLKEIGKKCVLAAYKCEFDSRHLVMLSKSSNLLSDFADTIIGFTDTLPLFEGKIVNVENHKLSTLASSKLKISCSDDRDAKYDVEILEKFSNNFLTRDNLIKINNETFADVTMS